MSKFLGVTQAITIEDFRLHPELLTNLILSAEDRSIVVEKRSNVIQITYLKLYSQEAKQLVAEARQEYQHKKSTGYDRNQAFADLITAKDEIIAQLAQPNTL